uniref:Cation-transporting P-type ATPase N-terminal domain-containing protein n=1 Tax=Acrobeloides nanus TaxID=290746 RepID=A0A914CEV4_9BILA
MYSSKYSKNEVAKNGVAKNGVAKNGWVNSVVYRGKDKEKRKWNLPWSMKKVAPAGKGTSKRRNLNEMFCEQTWDIDRIAQNYAGSQINMKNPASSKGLTSAMAENILKEQGLNMLPKAKEITNLQLFISQFLNMLWGLLLAATVFSLIGFLYDTSNLSGLWVTLIMIAMILILCTISFLQERKARAWCVGLKLETSSITGEAEPIEYQAEAVAEGVSVFDSRNIAFNSSLCVDGEAVGVVIRTAEKTVIGQIAEMTTGQADKKSRLQMQIRKYITILVIVAGTWGTGCFVIGGFVHSWKNPVNLLANAFLTIAIAIVPCGLPATVTSSLTLVAQRLVRKNVYLKKLDIVEALGSANIIASDKTGTLTKNIMTVTDIWYYDKFIEGVPEDSSTIHEMKSMNRYNPPLSDILTVMSVCNSSSFVEDGNQGKDRKNSSTIVDMAPIEDIGKKKPKTLPSVQDRKAIGTPSEVALIQYADKLISVDDVRDQYANKIVFEIPFNSKRKFHLMIAKITDLNDGQAEFKVMMKGAPEALIDRCSQMLTSNGEIDLTKIEMDKFQEAYEMFGASGRRVIGFIQKNFRAPANTQFSLDAENFPTKELCFLGVCAIMDPPRDETPGAIKMCKEAGIKVFMVTGDHHLTATAIAKQIGLIEEKLGVPDYAILHGEKISNLSEKEWDDVLSKNAVVFARTTPEQKLLIVEQAQKRKQVIAMTGDGVNDAPALKKAHIGVAMGTGSDVAKQAADIVLTDDNFASIVKAVEEGRLMYDNLKKLLGYTMCHTWPEVWSIVINFCFGMPIGMTALQILSIDLGTEIPPGVAMSKEPLEGDIMRRPPRATAKVLVSNSLLAYSYLLVGQLQSIACFLAYCCVFWSYNINISDLWMSATKSWTPDGEIFTSNGVSYTIEKQLYINRQACAAWQMGIVFGQVFHIFSSRTLRQSIFTHGFFTNSWAWIAIATELIMLGIFIYVPEVNSFLGGAPISWSPWLVVAAMGVVIFIYNEVRKYYIRKYPKNKIVSLFKW